LWRLNNEKYRFLSVHDNNNDLNNINSNPLNNQKEYNCIGSIIYFFDNIKRNYTSKNNPLVESKW